MKPSIIVAACLIFMGCVGLVVAQEPASLPQPAKEHQWLRKFVGHWDVVGKGVMAEGQPPVETKVTIKSEAVGGFWILNTLEGDADGLAFKGLQTIGYDTKKKKYVGTWVDSMNSYMWTYQGAVEKSGTKLVLAAEGPDMANPGKMASYRDSYEFKDDDTMTVISSMKNSDGKWVVFMTGTAKRKPRPDRR